MVVYKWAAWKRSEALLQKKVQMECVIPSWVVDLLRLVHFYRVSVVGEFHPVPALGSAMNSGRRITEVICLPAVLSALTIFAAEKQKFCFFQSWFSTFQQRPWFLSKAARERHGESTNA